MDAASCPLVDISCNCGVISAIGHHYTVSGNNDVYILQGGINIKKSDKVIVAHTKHNFYEMACKNCGCVFDLTFEEDILLVQKDTRQIKDSIFRPISLHRPRSLSKYLVVTDDLLHSPVYISMSMSSPPSMHKYDLEDYSSPMEEDEDYELMFSCNKECVVGSLSSNWIRMF